MMVVSVQRLLALLATALLWLLVCSMADGGRQADPSGLHLWANADTTGADPEKAVLMRQV